MAILDRIGQACAAAVQEAGGRKQKRPGMLPTPSKWQLQERKWKEGNGLDKSCSYVQSYEEVSEQEVLFNIVIGTAIGI